MDNVSRKGVGNDALFPLCVSCTTPRAGVYCSACGQREPRGRLTLRGVLHSAFHQLFDVEQGVLFTLLGLFRRPAQVARDYIRGATRRYVNPVKYFVLTLTSAQLVAWQTDVFSGLVAGFMDGADANPDISLDRATEWFAEAFVFVSALALPPVIVFARVMFGSAGYNAAEISVFYLYVCSQLAVLFVLVVPFSNLLPDTAGSVLIALMVIAQLVFFFWAHTAFFGGRPAAALLRTLVVVMAAAFVQLLVLAILTGMAGVLS